jgi:hypothetical protein
LECALIDSQKSIPKFLYEHQKKFGAFFFLCPFPFFFFLPPSNNAFYDFAHTHLSYASPHPSLRISNVQDKLIDPSSVTHLFKLTEKIGCVVTGLLPDSKALVAKARQMAAEFEFDHGYPIPSSYLARKIADDNQIYTQAAYKRASAVVMILGS